MVESIVHPVVSNETWQLVLRRSYLVVGVFVFPSTVHGCRAVRQSAWDCWARSNRKGGCYTNASFWHEGESWVKHDETCGLLRLNITRPFLLFLLDGRLWSNHSTWGVCELGGGADVSGAALATVWLHNCPHPSHARYSWWASLSLTGSQSKQQ